jgi:phosphate transport system protein
MRTDLQLQVDQLRTSVVEMGEHADGMLAAALRALDDNDAAAADLVVARDRALDAAYEQVQHRVLAVVALHGPVGRDLRLLTALIHISLHLERMGDYAVNVARTTKRAATFAPDRHLVDQLLEMGALARQVGTGACRAFATEDPDLARQAAALDDGVDRLNLGIFQRLVRAAAADESRLEWATRMIQLTRQLERYADHGVDIAEQVLFISTGQAVELSSNDPT